MFTLTRGKPCSVFRKYFETQKNENWFSDATFTKIYKRTLLCIRASLIFRMYLLIINSKLVEVYIKIVK